ncbi:histidine kinase dimerization/phosphoacceptor domain -containing protein [Hymenobacter terricola]|uniref:histidine kinase dimerization/phosphoacceptor domain -containing protein n=1 Tax=Hymenobacter terricola TaxID=2819236 RepID=UPI001B310178|nr:histidine kinase dimerization/phosphoacceptor domain -containing protein [Hymenobacter terricola]
MPRALLVLLLLLTGGVLAAEPLYPTLSAAAAARLRRQLWRTPPGRQRVDLLLRLSENLTADYLGLGTPLDSAGPYARQAARLSQRLGYARGQIRSQYALGNVALCLNQVPGGTRLLAQGLARSQQLPDPRLEADGWYYSVATYTFSAVDMPRRIACLRRALALYQALGDEERAAFILKAIADQHLTQGRLDLAQQELLQVLARYRTLGRPHYTYDLLNVVNAKAGNLQEALRYALAALESAQATGDTTFLNLFYGRVANLYNELNQPTDAVQYCRIALRRAEREHDASDVVGIVNTLAKALIKLKQPQQALALALEQTRNFPVTDGGQIDRWEMLATCYLANRQYAAAERSELEIIKLLANRKTLAGNGSKLRRAYSLLGQVYLLTKRYDDARHYLSRAAALQSEASISGQAPTERLLFKLDSAQGRYLAAIAHQQRYQVLTDSIFNERKSKQIANLQIQYETRKKEQDMALLTKQSLVQQANLRQREVQRNTSLAGVFMLALLLGLGYNRYRLKQRNNRLLEAQQTEISAQNHFLEKLLTEKSGLLEEKEWMLKEIHHRVKNNLQIIGSLLRSQAVYLKDGVALAAVRESRNRVHSMALIHQKLYQSNRLAGVPMDAYIQEIVDHLLASFDCQGLVRAELTVAAVELDVALAVPVGLILNEAITNTLKYAFPAGRGGRLSIGLEEMPATGHFRLSICDDGVGLPADFEPQQSRTLGLELIRGLSKQIGGRLEVASAHGVQIRLEFDQLELAPRG